MTAYGGAPENRARLVVGVATAVAAAIGPDRVGLRVSPGHGFNDIVETEIAETHEALVRGLEPLGLLYLHIAEDPGTRYQDALRKLFGGPVVLSTGFAGASDLATAQEAVDSGAADLFAIGRGFLTNPDLVERLRTGAASNEPDPGSFYAGSAKGCTGLPAARGLVRLRPGVRPRDPGAGAVLSGPPSRPLPTIPSTPVLGIVGRS